MQHNNDIYFERRITVLEMQFERIDKKLDDLILNQVTKSELQIELAKINTKLDLELNKIDSKLDILENKIDKKLIGLEAKIDKSVNKIAWKVGSIVIAWITIYPFVLQYFGQK